MGAIFSLHGKLALSRVLHKNEVQEKLALFRQNDTAETRQDLVAAATQLIVNCYSGKIRRYAVPWKYYQNLCVQAEFLSDLWRDYPERFDLKNLYQVRQMARFSSEERQSQGVLSVSKQYYIGGVLPAPNTFPMAQKTGSEILYLVDSADIYDRHFGGYVMTKSELQKKFGYYKDEFTKKGTEFIETAEAALLGKALKPIAVRGL